MAAQLFRRHVAHCSDGLSRVRINGFPWTGRQNFASPKSANFRQLAHGGVTRNNPSRGSIFSDGLFQAAFRQEVEKY